MLKTYRADYSNRSTGEYWSSFFQADDPAHAFEQAWDAISEDNGEDAVDNVKEVRFYIHKFEIHQCYGGPEEGGWWYDAGEPTEGWIPMEYFTEEAAEEDCRIFNRQESNRREKLEYNYTSVLSHREEFYTFMVTTDRVAKPFPERRPHYE